MRKVCFLLILLIMPVFAYGEKLFSPYGQYGIQQFEQNGKMGICDNIGNTIIEAEYEYISPDFHNGCAMLIKDHLIGFLMRLDLLFQNRFGKKLGITNVDLLQ